ncbi:MAG TPA: hypothetical protein DEF59_03460 [Candidatus Magasanikbacteria bacterium]|nr:hypothetical protein [Candidatus Magasanikbacteria bacterium]
MKIISQPISRSALSELAKETFGDMIKAVVDVDKKIVALSGELHADEESILLEQGSLQEHLWGINLYPEIMGENFIEFDSMINIKPRQGNRSRGVESEEVRKKIKDVVHILII